MALTKVAASLVNGAQVEWLDALATAAPGWLA